MNFIKMEEVPTFKKYLESYIQKVTTTPFTQLSGKDQFNLNRLRQICFNIVDLKEHPEKDRGLYECHTVIKPLYEIETIVSPFRFGIFGYYKSLRFEGDHKPLFQDWIEWFKYYYIPHLEELKKGDDPEKFLEWLELKKEVSREKVKKLEAALTNPSVIEGEENTYIFEPILEGYQRLLNYHSNKNDFTMRFYSRGGHSNRLEDGTYIKEELKRIDNLLGERGFKRSREDEKDVTSTIVIYDNSKFEKYMSMFSHRDEVTKIAEKFKLDYRNVPFGPWNSSSWNEHKDFEERMKHDEETIEEQEE